MHPQPFPLSSCSQKVPKVFKVGANLVQLVIDLIGAEFTITHFRRKIRNLFDHVVQTIRKRGRSLFSLGSHVYFPKVMVIFSAICKQSRSIMNATPSIMEVMAMSVKRPNTPASGKSLRVFLTVFFLLVIFYSCSGERGISSSESKYSSSVQWE